MILCTICDCKTIRARAPNFQTYGSSYHLTVFPDVQDLSPEPKNWTLDGRLLNCLGLTHWYNNIRRFQSISVNFKLPWSILIDIGQFRLISVDLGQFRRFWSNPFLRSILSISVNSVDFGQLCQFWSIRSILVNSIDFAQFRRFWSIPSISVNLVDFINYVNFSRFRSTLVDFD